MKESFAELCYLFALTNILHRLIFSRLLTGQAVTKMDLLITNARKHKKI